MGKRGFNTAVFAAAMCLALSACAGQDNRRTEKSIYAQGRTIYKPGDHGADNVVSTIWDSGEYGYVRIVQAEPSANGPNDHPVNLNPEEIRSLFRQLKVERNGDSTKIFDDRELGGLMDRLASALSKAGPNHDVTFALSTQKGNFSIFSPRVITTGRMFYKAGRLNVIFGKVHDNYSNELRATGILRPYTPGSRDGRIEKGWSIQTGNVTQYAYADRKEWVQTLSGSDFGRGAASLGNTTTSILPQSAPGSVQPAGPVPIYDQENPYYQSIEDQLMGLLRLRRLDLITEEEYQRKRSAIINQL